MQTKILDTIKLPTYLGKNIIKDHFQMFNIKDMKNRKKIIRIRLTKYNNKILNIHLEVRFLKMIIKMGRYKTKISIISQN